MLACSVVNALLLCAFIATAFSASLRQRHQEPAVHKQNLTAWNSQLAGKERKPILVYQAPSVDQLGKVVKPTPRHDNSPVRMRSVDGGANKNQKQGSGKMQLGAAGYVTIVAVVGLVCAAFVVAMYAQQRDDGLPLEESNSKASEAKQVLKTRLYVVKRYIQYRFEAGLPCPEKMNVSSSSSDESVSPNAVPSSSKPTKTRVKKALVINK